MQFRESFINPSLGRRSFGRLYSPKFRTTILASKANKLLKKTNSYEAINCDMNKRKRFSNVGNRMTKRSKPYRKFQMSVYNFLERPMGGYAIGYQFVMYK